MFRYVPLFPAMLGIRKANNSIERSGCGSYRRREFVLDQLGLFDARLHMSTYQNEKQCLGKKKTKATIYFLNINNLTR